MRYRSLGSLFILSISVFFPCFISGDSIHFKTGEAEESDQIWYGEVLRINDYLVEVRFKHNDISSIHTIHVSRILSIYFNENYEHTFPIRLRDIISNPIPGDLDRLRRLYLYPYNEEINQEYSDIKIFGPHGNKSLRGNLEEYNKERNIMSVVVKTLTNNNKSYTDWELSLYIRAWVR